MAGHQFRASNSFNRVMYRSSGVSVSFEAARMGALTNHDFLDVTMTTIDVEVAGGSK